MFHKVRKKDFNLSHRRRQLFDNLLFMPTHLPVLFSFPFSSSLLRFTWGHFSYCSIFRPHSRPSQGAAAFWFVAGGLSSQGPHSGLPLLVLDASRGVVCALEYNPCLSCQTATCGCFVTFLSSQPLTCHSRRPLQLVLDPGCLTGGRTEQRSQLGGGECRVGRPWSLHLLLLKTEEKLW